MPSLDTIRILLDLQNKIYWYTKGESVGGKFCAKYNIYVDTHFDECGNCNRCIDGGR